MTTKRSKDAPPMKRFPPTYRIQAYEQALDAGLHLVRDNFHLWAVRKTDKAHVWLCSTTSYDGLWRAACVLFQSPDFDVDLLPYSIGETENQVTLYDPKLGQTRLVDKKDLRKKRSEVSAE